MQTTKEIASTGLYFYLIRYTFDKCYKEFTNVSLTKDRYIFSDDIELAPIEDYGDYLLSDCKVNNPVEEWLLLKGDN